MEVAPSAGASPQTRNEAAEEAIGRISRLPAGPGFGDGAVDQGWLSPSGKAGSVMTFDWSLTDLSSANDTVAAMKTVPSPKAISSAKIMDFPFMYPSSSSTDKPSVL